MVRAIAIVLDFISGVLFPEFISGRDHILCVFCFRNVSGLQAERLSGGGCGKRKREKTF